jgi:hypothetical protein
LTFCDPVPAQSLEQLSQMSASDWQKLLYWLDTSGLALYFLDRMVDLQLWHTLPHVVFARLKQNLTDNSSRMRSLINESLVIQGEFQRTGVPYVTLKGFSLHPYSVPRLELRSQLDLDFLVSEKNVPDFRTILEGRGYHLHAMSGRTWEFKTDHVPIDSLDCLYKDVPHRCVELHVEPDRQEYRSPLANRTFRDFHGIRMPVLPAADLFVNQGFHVFKHVCSESSRTAHLLEFRRHVMARRDDASFWNEVRAIGEASPRVPVALGVVTLLITRLMGDFAPEALTCWSVDRLPTGARFWIELHGHRSVFAGFRGTKLYLFLQRELEPAGIPATRTVRRALMPLRLPPPVTRITANDTFWIRVRRHRLQLKFILMRLRFHAVEGLRYLWESLRWRRNMSQFARTAMSGTLSEAPLLSVPNSLSTTTKE